MLRTPPLPPGGRLTGRLRVLVVAAVALLALTGCSSSPSEEGGAGAAGGGAFPVTVEHAFGQTEITEAPQRVVTLGYTDPDALLAVGVAPVGIVDWYAEPPAGNKWRWQEAAFGGATPEVVGVREDYNLEKIASLRPDLIIASYSGMTQRQFDEVSRIAPTVAQPRGFEPFTAPWQVMTQQITRAVGQEQRGRELTAQVEGRINEVRAAHPQWASQTAIAAAYEAPNYAIFQQGDVKNDLLRSLGFQAPPAVAALADGSSDVEISPERAGLLEVDKLFMLATNPQVQAEIRSRPEFAQLPVAQQNRVLWVLSSERAEPLSGALGYSSVLSLPYALDLLVPRLEALPPRS